MRRLMWPLLPVRLQVRSHLELHGCTRRLQSHLLKGERANEAQCRHSNIVPRTGELRTRCVSLETRSSESLESLEGWNFFCALFALMIRPNGDYHRFGYRDLRNALRYGDSDAYRIATIQTNKYRNPYTMGLHPCVLNENKTITPRLLP